jgi:hypothetical protein
MFASVEFSDISLITERGKERSGASYEHLAPTERRQRSLGLRSSVAARSLSRLSFVHGGCRFFTNAFLVLL